MDGLALTMGLAGAAGTLIAAVLGARLGGRYVKESVQLAAEKARLADQEKEHQEIANLRKALLVEIVTLMAAYMEASGRPWRRIRTISRSCTSTPSTSGTS